MSKLTQIKNAIDQLDGGAFQNLCEQYLFYKRDFISVSSTGIKVGTNKTAKGNPDTFFRKNDGTYALVMCTTQKDNFKEKAVEDIKKCLNPQQVHADIDQVSEIIFCHTNNRITIHNQNTLESLCCGADVKLTLIGIDDLANDIYKSYPHLANDHLGISIDTEQVLSSKAFIKKHDRNQMMAPLETEFLFRKKEKSEAKKCLTENSVLLVSGPAGIGKTRFALEICEIWKKENNYIFLCIQNNGLQLFDDLKANIDLQSNYIILVDDANELTVLKHVLAYASDEPEKRRQFKFVLTVRNYAYKQLVQEVSNYLRVETIQLNELSDEEIKELVKSTLGIKNELFLEQINRIANGNARLAILAGKIAVQSDSLESIRNATDLYTNYYGNQISNILSGSTTELKTAGIISILRVFRFDAIDKIKDLFEIAGITEEDFKRDIQRLHYIEIVDICNDSVVAIADQSFGNYLIKNIFVDKNIIPLHKVLEVTFSINVQRAIEICNILLNIFSDEKAVEDAIKTAWNDLKDNEDLFPKFFRAFYIIRPTESLCILKERIEQEESVPFEYDNVDLESIEIGNIPENDTVSILGGFSDHEQFPQAMELLIDYYLKRPDQYKQVYAVISRNYNINEYSEQNDYHTQKTVAEVFSKKLLANNAKHLQWIFIAITAPFLSFRHEYIEGNKRNSITMYHFDLLDSVDIISYRKLFWEQLLSIYVSGNFKIEIDRLLLKYVEQAYRQADKELIKQEYVYLLPFFDYMDTQNLYHCVIATYTYSIGKKNGEELHQLEKFIDNEKFNIFCSLCKTQNEWQGTDDENDMGIKSYNLLELVESRGNEAIKNIFIVAGDSEREIPKARFHVTRGLEKLFDRLANRKQQYITIIDEYLKSDTPCDINPIPIITKLFNFMEPANLESFLLKNTYKQKPAWHWAYYVCMPKDKIKSEHAGKVLELLSIHLLDGDAVGNRYVDSLQKYQSVRPGIVLEASDLLLKANQEEQTDMMSYFNSVLHTGKSVDITLEMFQGGIQVLAEIYLQCLFKGPFDYDGTLLLAILDRYPEFLGKYIDRVIDKAMYHSLDYSFRLFGIWEKADYGKHMDCIFEHVYNSNQKYREDSVLTNLFLGHEKDDAIVIERQNKWIHNMIEHNYNNIEFMNQLFYIVFHLSIERRKEAIAYFISLNPSIEAFKRLPLEPMSLSGSPSLIPAMQRRIENLRLLLPLFSEIQYLEHRKYIEGKIAAWEKWIHQEENRDFLDKYI